MSMQDVRPALCALLFSLTALYASASDVAAIVHGGACPLQFSPDGTMLVLGGPPQPQVYDARNGRFLRAMTPCEPVPLYYSSYTFSPDGKTLVAESAGLSYAWETATGKSIRHVNLPSLARRANSADGMLCAVYSETEHAVHVRDIHGGAIVATIPNVIATGLAFSPNKRMLAIANMNTVQLWELATAHLRHEFHGHDFTIIGLQFSPTGKRIASGAVDNTVILWDPFLHERTKNRMREAPSIEELWNTLEEKDAGKAYLAMCALAARPALAIPRIKHGLLELRRASPNIDRLVRELNDERYVVRQRASHELRKAGRASQAALQGLLVGNSSLETQQRARQLLAEFDAVPSLPAAKLQTLRAHEVLEMIGTPEARALLQDAAHR